MASPVADSYKAPSGGVIAGGRVALQPIIATGSYVGNGSSQTVALGFRPDLVLTKASGQYLIWHGAYGWHGRSNRIHAAESISNGVTLTDTGFTVGSHGDVNANGGDFDFLAIANNGSDVLSVTSWMGNLTDNREISFTKNKPIFTWVKRDSGRPAVLKHSSMVSGYSITSDATGSGSFIRDLLDYGLRINADVKVNELNGPATVGEGIECVAVADTPWAKVVTWTGNGSANRSIDVGFQPCAYLLMRDDGAASQAVFKTDTMATGECAFVGNNGNTTGRVGALTATGFDLVDTTYNLSGVAYSAICFKKNDPAKRALSILNPDIPGVQLSGSGSSIQIGNDVSLNVGSGAFSIEWFGRIDSFQNQAIPLFMRGECDNGTVSNAGKMSWGVFAYPPIDPYAHGWVGHVLRVVHGDYYAATLTESDTNYYCWNTGIRLPAAGDDLHLIITHDGAGHWRVCMNGRWVKDRAINLEQSAFGNRSNGGAGSHRVTVGARRNSDGSIQDSAPVTVFGIKVYDHALTDDEGRNRFDRAYRGLNVPDVTPVESWDFSAASGSTLPALASAANNAAIVGGSWVTR